MEISISLISYGVLFLIFLSITYFSKERIRSKENKIYSFGIIVTIIGSLLEIISSVMFYTNNYNNSLFSFITRLIFIYYLLWSNLLLFYYMITVSKNQNMTYKLIRKILVFNTIIFAFILTGPLKLIVHNNVMYPDGILVIILYTIIGLILLVLFFILILNITKIPRKKFFPLLLLVILGVSATIIQYNHNTILLTTPVIIAITFVMYFTIENPDVKMLNELIENRKIIERSSEEKSIFLFKMSQGIKEPSKNIEKEITRYEEGKNTKEKVNNIIQNIDRENGKINYLVNDVMGLTSFDGSKIKKVEGSYNIYSLLEDIKIRAKGYKKNDIDYTFTTVENIPKELIGDRVAIKQVLMSLIINAFNNTSKGYVHVDVNSITKYDVCRLVITIEDSGSGIEINKINEILNQEEELTNEEYLKLDKIDIDLPLSYKIIKSLGGTMYIRSEVGKGTSITITLDQYIIEDEDEKRSKRIEEYIKDKNSLGKILLVDDNEKEISKIKKYLNKKGYDVSLVMYGEEVIKRIKDKEKYDYIMIDDELETMSGISLLKELNKEKDKSKKIVILDKDKLFISDHYIEDGFNDYIDRENLIKELDRLF